MSVWRKKLRTARQVFQASGWRGCWRYVGKRLADACHLRRVVLMQLDTRQPLPPVRGVSPWVEYRRLTTGADVRQLAAMAPDLTEADILRRLEAGERCAIAVQDGAIVGYGWLREEGEYEIPYVQWRRPLPPRTVYCYNLYVAPAYRGRGIGRRLQIARLAASRERVYDTVLIAVMPGDQRIVHYHARHGFRAMATLWYLRCGGLRAHWRRPALQRADRMARAVTRSRIAAVELAP